MNDGDPSLAGNPSLLRAIDETRGCRISSIDETEPWATWPDVGRSRDTHAKREAQRASPTAHPTPLSRCYADAMDAASWLAGSAERGWLDPAQAQRLEVCVVGVGDGGRPP